MGPLVREHDRSKSFFIAAAGGGGNQAHTTTRVLAFGRPQPTRRAPDGRQTCEGSRLGAWVRTDSGHLPQSWALRESRSSEISRLGWSLFLATVTAVRPPAMIAAGTPASRSGTIRASSS